MFWGQGPRKGIMRIDRDREQELATTVQVRRHALLDLLTPDERKTMRHVGSAEAETFEDHAREIASFEDRQGSRVARVRHALAAYVEAINTFWTYAQESGVDGYLASTWRSKHKGYAWIAFDDLACEALFKLRHFIGLFKVENGNLADYAMRGVHQHLTEFAAKQGPIEVPQKEARKTGPSSYRVSLDAATEIASEKDVPDGLEDFSDELSYDPTDAIHAFLDGDITEEDL